MFHGKHVFDDLDRAADWAGIDLTLDQGEKLVRFCDWLDTEAVDAGGIGPGERERLIDRHVADSLIFAAAWDGAPRDILDVGSGVGLPGIPLAIAYPHTPVTLLDRSQKRCWLARRAVRVLDLENVMVEQRDLQSQGGSWSAIVFRGSLNPEAAIVASLPLMSEQGCVVVGVSRSAEPDHLPKSPPGTTLDLLTVDPRVLDSPAWLLRMTLTNPRSPDRDAS
jgi:16S rRNA (guanine527-N7)-methyltransferase